MKKENKKDKIYITIFISLIIITSIILRIVLFKGKSGDYRGFLLPWVKEIRRLGYFKSLKYIIGNYNVPYMVILTLISFLKCSPLYPIKIVSVIFDYLLMFIGIKIFKKESNDEFRKILLLFVLAISPTVLFNSALWAQCDSIYTFFMLLSLYYLMDKKYILSFIMLGVSFSFKLQFIFILPLYIIMLFRDKNIKIYHFLLIPLTNIVMCLPALIAGMNFKSMMLIYFNQSNTYSDLVLNYPNIYNFFSTNVNVDLITKLGILFTALLFFLMWLYCIKNKVIFNKKKIIMLGLWSIIICVYFLPRMHDRYMYAAEFLSIIYSFTYKKDKYLPITLNVLGIITYLKFLYDIVLIDFRISAIIILIALIIYTKSVLKELIKVDKIKKEKKYKRKKVIE